MVRNEQDFVDVDKIDIHKIPPLHEISVDRVGVSDVDFLLTVETVSKENVIVDARLDMFGSLLKDIKGIDMSRFSEVLMQWTDKPLSSLTLKDLLLHLKKSVKAADVYVSASFRYFMKKQAPVTKLDQLVAYPCKFVGVLNKVGYTFIHEVQVPVMSLCPCSKERCLVDRERDIGKGAHNQRGIITLQVKCQPGSFYIEDLVKLAESCGSAEIYSLLKRPDEEYVTRVSYENPKFVEDIVRETAAKVKELPGVSWFRAKVENFESIHHHSAVAYISKQKYGKGGWKASTKGFY